MSESVIGKVFADRYRVDSAVRTGDEVELYRGTNVVLERPVIIKVLPAEASTDLFLAEAKNVSHLTHPNILPVWDFGESGDGRAFVVYEDFDGEPLDHVMERAPQMPIHPAVSIVKGIAQGIAAAEIFGGACPSNVLVHNASDQPSGVKIYNFSVSQNESNEYAAPEVASDRADERSDIYSLSILLYRLLAGELPFTPERPEGVPPPPLASFRHDLPSGLEAVILKAMTEDRAMRQQSLAEFSDELTAGASTKSAAAAAGNNVWKTAFVVLAGITLLAAALIYATSVKQTYPTTQLQTDANGQPVQPINPATGVQEQNLSNMQGMTTMDVNSNANIGVPPGTLPGGDGYDPWRNGGMPPPGAPKIGPGGQTVTIDPNGGSPFMPADTANCVMQPSGILLCPVPLTNANAATKKPTPTPKTSANANVQTSPSPQGTPETRPSPAANKPAAKPTRSPAANSAAPRGKPGETN
jgi:serine/threonine-protein kinase